MKYQQYHIFSYILLITFPWPPSFAQCSVSFDYSLLSLVIPNTQSRLHSAENSLHKVALRVAKYKTTKCHIQFSSYQRSTPFLILSPVDLLDFLIKTTVHSHMQMLLHLVRLFMQTKVGENIRSLVNSNVYWINPTLVHQICSFLQKLVCWFIHHFPSHAFILHVVGGFILPCIASSILFANVEIW